MSSPKFPSASLRTVVAMVAAISTVVPIAAVPFSALAQSAAPDAPTPDTAAKKPKRNPYASPLDTIMSTRLWTDVPPAQDFVRQSRPDPKSLDYVPLTGKEPDRPTPRDPDGVAALQEELEKGGADNAARAKDLTDPPAAAPSKPAGGKPARHARKTTPRKAASAVP
jgi:hypothetical protein